MNLRRYFIAGSLSIAIHSSIFWTGYETKAYAMPTGSHSSSVTIRFSPVSVPNTVQSTKPKQEPAPSAKSALNEIKSAPVAKELTIPKGKPARIKAETDIIASTTSQKLIEQNQPKNPIKTPSVEQPSKETLPQPTDVQRGVSTKPLLVNQPSFLSKPTPPVYPRLARKRGLTGVVTYEVWLDEYGMQISQTLISSSGQAILDKSALRAIKTWKFSPHSVNGQKIAHRVRIPVRFNMD
ncbi:cell envelope protein TonB [Vibrio zhanjiangensis]|uniref:Cell envelope protein TonB n=1 Tax=Vibrio zhanjiangensis TaxID=1046128 RepID=A0ABQ6F0F0_9VIBR|nr:energy transducer TonB [Vibrio zhanjiangensis]GLT18741.1 cell envelope protein TonB [Vibrio zhanjiangensis]